MTGASAMTLVVRKLTSERAMVFGSKGSKQELMKSWRSGFMRWRSREEPCESHHEEARREK